MPAAPKTAIGKPTYRTKALRRELEYFVSEVERTGHAESTGAGTLTGRRDGDSTTYTIQGGGVAQGLVLVALPFDRHADQLLDLVDQFIAAVYAQRGRLAL